MPERIIKNKPVAAPAAVAPESVPPPVQVQGKPPSVRFVFEYLPYKNGQDLLSWFQACGDDIACFLRSLRWLKRCADLPDGDFQTFVDGVNERGFRWKEEGALPPPCDPSLRVGHVAYAQARCQWSFFLEHCREAFLDQVERAADVVSAQGIDESPLFRFSDAIGEFVTSDGHADDVWPPAKAALDAAYHRMVRADHASKPAAAPVEPASSAAPPKHHKTVESQQTVAALEPCVKKALATYPRECCSGRRGITGAATWRVMLDHSNELLPAEYRKAALRVSESGNDRRWVDKATTILKQMARLGKKPDPRPM